MNWFKNEFRAIFYVKDYDKNVRFYGQGLELESNYSWDDGPEDKGIKYLAGNGVIEIVRRNPPMEQGKGSVMIEAKNVNECYEALRSKQWLNFTEHLADRPYGVRVFRLLDPNGNDVIIFSYIKDIKGAF
ncbi:MAG: VOC family protein [Christensenellales bacterium]|jgi:catechol 2,3-dioxygenase-like lactoylglutathione lyase family enzyme